MFFIYHHPRPHVYSVFGMSPCSLVDLRVDDWSALKMQQVPSNIGINLPYQMVSHP